MLPPSPVSRNSCSQSKPKLETSVLVMARFKNPKGQWYSWAPCRFNWQRSANLRVRKCGVLCFTKLAVLHLDARWFDSILAVSMSSEDTLWLEELLGFSIESNGSKFTRRLQHLPDPPARSCLLAEFKALQWHVGTKSNLRSCSYQLHGPSWHLFPYKAKVQSQNESDPLVTNKLLRHQTPSWTTKSFWLVGVTNEQCTMGIPCRAVQHPIFWGVWVWQNRAWT